MQGRATLIQEVQLEEETILVGIDVSKAQVDIAVRSTGQRWVVTYNETGVEELLSQMVDLGPALVLLEATADWNCRWWQRWPRRRCRWW